MDRLAGIYKIENIKNGKIYIGESEDIPRRWVEHLTELILKRHHSYKLQNDFNEYSISDFNFEVVETILITDKSKELTSSNKLKMILLCREYAYMKYFKSIEEGYNIEKTIIQILEKKKDLFGGELKDDNDYLPSHLLKTFLKQNKQLLDLNHELVFDDIILSDKKKKSRKKKKDKYNRTTLTTIYKQLKTNNIINKSIKMIDFRTILCAHNIIQLKDYSYHATNYSLENDLLINGAIQKNPQGYKHNQVLVTPKGEQYIKEIFSNQQIT